MTDEQLEQKISEEFEKWFNSELEKAEKDKSLSGLIHLELFEGNKEAFSNLWKAAALPLMKKIASHESQMEGLESERCHSVGVIEKFQKENEELRGQLHCLEDMTKEMREALSFVINESLSPYECATDEQYKDRLTEIRTKFNLDTTTNELLPNTKNSSSDKEGGK